MENIGTNQTGAQWTEREKELAENFKVEPKLVRLMFEIISEQQQPVDPLQPERNSIIIEDFFFERVEFSGQLAAVLLFNLLMSSSPRHRSIGRHILKRLYENIEQTDGCPSEEDMLIREILFCISKGRARKSA